MKLILGINERIFTFPHFFPFFSFPFLSISYGVEEAVVDGGSGSFFSFPFFAFRHRTKNACVMIGAWIAMPSLLLFSFFFFFFFFLSSARFSVSWMRTFVMAYLLFLFSPPPPFFSFLPHFSDQDTASRWV